MTTLLITVDAATDIVMSGSKDTVTALGITAYSEPAIQTRLNYAPSAGFTHGDSLLGWSYQQTSLVFSVAAINAASESAAKALIDALRAAVTQFSYNVTVNVNGAGNVVWACDPGTVTPAAERTYADLKNHNPEWVVTIPCYPIPS